jgi:hypothetical protein
LQRLMRGHNPEIADDMEPVIDKLRKYQGQIERRSGGKLYHVEIDAEPDQLLHWDRTVGNQPGEVRDRLLDVVNGARARGLDPAIGWDTHGDDVYNQLARQRQNIAPGQFAEQAQLPSEASRMLREAGIPGIRYLDQGSRGSAGGTSNYVIFDDKLVKILGKE